MTAPTASPAAAPVAYWRRARQVTLLLLAAWLVVTVLAVMPSLWPAHMGPGRPLAFWFGAQGALILFLLIVVVYAWVMGRLEAALRAAEGG